MMAAFFATNVRLGTTSTVLDGGKFQCICSRNLQTISQNKQKSRAGRSVNVHIVRKKSRFEEKLNISGATEISDKIVQDQGSVQWPKLRVTVSGLKASVSNLSVPWRNENDVNKDSNIILETRQSVENAVNKDTNYESLSDPSVVSKFMDSKIAADDSLHDIKSDTDNVSNEQWVTQILDIHDEKSNDQDQETDEVKTDQVKNNISASKKASDKNISAERLGDPFAQIDSKVISTKSRATPLATSNFSSRINFSYFTKSKNSTKSLKKSLEEKKAKNGQNTNGTAASQGPSTMDRIRGAVNFSSAKKNSSNSAVEGSNENETDKELDKKTDSPNKEMKVAAGTPIASTQTEGDWSYWSMLSNIQQSVLLNLPLSSSSKTLPENQTQAAQIAQNVVRSELVSESGLITRTTNLSDNLVQAESAMSKLKRLDELCTHLTKHPQFRHISLKHKVLPCLLQMRNSGNPKIDARANEALALIGYTFPPQGRGIRMLSIDGGGTRGLIALEMMERIEQLCNRPISEMFDFVTGSSTGALMAALVFIFKIPLPECKEMYLDRSARMFVKESLLKKTRNMALHDVKIFEEILQTEMGTNSLISTSRDPTIPKFAVTSTLANVPKWKTYMFRNYNHPPGVVSDYEGSCNLKVWEAVRASGSAPVYFSPFQIGEYVFRDGGCIANNPTAVGLHECKLLWPHESFQCVLSLGNGRYDPSLAKEEKTKGGYSVIPKAMKDLADGFIDSATDTEGVHLILKNTLPPSSYFRLSPYLRENYELSEVKPEKINQMIGEARSYIDRNHILMQKVADKLKQERLPNQRIVDFTSQRKQTHDYFLF